jgi:hypothetical protein
LAQRIVADYSLLLSAFGLFRENANKIGPLRISAVAYSPFVVTVAASWQVQKMYKNGRIGPLLGGLRDFRSQKDLQK